MKVEQYLVKMKNLVDKLKLAGSPISNSDLTIQILNDLDSDYNSVVVKLFDEIDISWVELQTQLLTFESRLEQLNNFSSLNLNASVNFATKNESRGTKFGSQGDWRGSNFRGMRGGIGRGRMSKPIGQVCRRSGHTTIQCYYRFDKSYIRKIHSSESEKQGTYSAFIASPYQGQDHEWYFDNGDNNHVTHQSDKLHRT